MKPTVNLVTLFLFLIWNIGECSAKRKIPVGGIFHEDNHVTERAFHYAIDRLNMYNHNVELIPVTRIISGTDGYKTWNSICNMTEEGVAAIFGPFSPITAEVSSSVSMNMEIPNILAHWDPEKIDNDFVLNIFPEADKLSDAMFSLVTDYEWTGYVIIYDTNEALVRLNSLLQKHEPSDPAVTLRQLSEDGDYRPMFKELRNHSASRLILDCDPELVLTVLRQAKEVNMLGEYHNYIITSLDAHTLDFSEFTYDLTNITGIRLINVDGTRIIDAVRDWQQGELRFDRGLDISPSTVKTETALLYDAVFLFAVALDKLLADEEVKFEIQSIKCDEPTKWSLGSQLIENMKTIRLEEGTTGSVHFDETGRRTNFDIEIIELNKDKFEAIATWNSFTNEISQLRGEEGLKLKVDEDIRNKKFIVVSRLGAPYLRDAKSEDGKPLEGNARWEGYSMDLIDEISKVVGFTYEFYIVKDGKYGAYSADTKQWNGLVRELLDNKADMAICDLTITFDRRTAVDFTMPFMTLGISILFDKMEEESAELFSFLNPFHYEVWIYMGAAYLGVSILLYLVSRIAPDDWENPHPCNEEPEELENIWNFMNSFWLTMGSIMGQGCDLLPKAISTRMVTGMWWFFALIMANSYTANLAAFLTQSAMGVEIKDATGLAAQTTVKYGAVEGGSTLAFFKNSKVATYQRMWAAMEAARPSVFTEDNDTGMNRILKSKHKYAFLMESTSLEYLKYRDCRLAQIGGLLDSKGYGIALPKDSRYRTHISGAVLKLQEEGKLMKLKTKWWKTKNVGGECEADKPEENSTKLGISNVGGVFVILGAGCGVAVIIAVLEFIWNVRSVAVNEKISTIDAFKAEILFVMKVWITTKPAQPVSSESSSGKSENSRSRSISRISSKIVDILR